MKRAAISTLLPVCILLIIAAWLRLPGLDWGLPSGEHIAASYRSDEYTLFAWLRKMNPASGNFDIGLYGIGPLLLYILAAFLKLLSMLNIIYISSSAEFYYQNPAEWRCILLSGRYLMIVFGLLTVITVYRAAVYAFGKRAGFLAGFLCAIIPGHVVLSKHMLVEPVGTLWISLCILFAFKIIRSGTLRNYFYMGILLGSACALKITFISLALLLVCAHFMGRAHAATLIEIFRASIDYRPWISVLGAVAAYIFFNPFAVLHPSETLKGIQKYFGFFQNYWGQLEGGWFSITQLYPYLVGCSFAFASLATCLWALFSRKKEAWLLLISFVAHFYLLYRSNSPTLKYYVVLIPFIVILIAEFLNTALEKSSTFGKMLAVLLIIILSVNTFNLSWSYNKLFTSIDARDVASAWIRDNIPAGKTIGVLMEPYYQSPPVLYNQYFFTGKSAKRREPHLYSVTILDGKSYKMGCGGEDFIVVSSRENRAYIGCTGDRRYIASWNLLHSLLSNCRYKLVKVFKNELKGLPAMDQMEITPSDWDQILPEIRIYKNLSH